MSTHVAKRAVVVGAGMGGLAAAGALADHVEEVLVLERDELPGDGSHRAGIPQGRHVHALLAGGRLALADLFPDFEESLIRTGAVRVQVDEDMIREAVGRPPFPRRDLGFYSYAVSRPALEETVRGEARALENVVLEDRCRVERLLPSDGGGAVRGVLCSTPDGESRPIEADLVVDASGRGRLTLDFLEEHGHPLPESTTIGVDMCYSSAVFEIPDDDPGEWKGAFALPTPPDSSRGALLLPLEGGRWIVSLGGRLGQDPPGDHEGFLEFARGLHSSTIFGAISRAKPVGDVVRYRFPESVRRHYARLPTFPGGLLPIADSLCRFNPIYGQGMSVAAQEAYALARLLTERSAEPDPLDGLAAAFFEAAEHVVDTPWMTAAMPDLVYPGTRGERPADFADRIRRSAALNRLAMEDPEVHKVFFEVRHLLRPHEALSEPWLTERLAEST